MKKVLVVLTNVDHFEKDGEKTGLWLSEATELVNEVERAGYEVEYVSPRGGSVPIDPRSLQDQFVSPSDRSLYESEDFRHRALDSSKAPEDIRPEDYLAIYYTGGHGVAGLFNVKGPDGGYLVAGKEVTGFTDQNPMSGKAVADKLLEELAGK